MAILQSLSDGSQHPVAARMLIGRSAACGLRLDDRHVSGEHATLCWTGGHWEIRDLGSRNGTYVDGARLNAGQSARLIVGSRVAFGDPDRTYELVDEEPPSVMAFHSELPKVEIGQNDLLVLPNSEHPEVSLYADARGWWLDNGDGQPIPFDGQSPVHTSQGMWQVELPAVSEGTPLMQLQLSVDTIELQFDVSRDEERVHITVVGRGVDVPLPPREHGYVLLTLARARQQDAALPTNDRGWRDRNDLERMLALDSNALNVAIHRARQQLSAVGVQGAARVVEVRRKQRRLGVERFRICTLEDK